MSRTAKSSRLLNAIGSIINPATQETLQTVSDGISSLGGSATTVASGRKVVAITNTAIVIGSAACKTIFITALATNTNPIVWGDSGVVYTEAIRQGASLYPNDKVTISIDNLSKIYINGAAGDGVSFTYNA